MFSKMISSGAKKLQAGAGFGDRYDDELLTLLNKAGAALTYEVNAIGCQRLYNEMPVGFEPLCGLFIQFNYLPVKLHGKFDD